MTNQVIPHSLPTLEVEEMRAASLVIETGDLAAGYRCLEFERAIAQVMGTRFGSVVSSGFAALHTAILALGITQGDEVILPSYACEALLHAALQSGAKPVIVDVCAQTGNISSAAACDAMSSRTKLILVAHMFGTPADMLPLQRLGVPILEDCALAIGASHGGQKVGSFGKASITSFYATKMLCTGEGGAVCTDDSFVASKVADLRDYRGRSDFSSRFNYLLTDLAAAIGNVQISKLNKFIARRRYLASVYDGLLENIKDVERPCPIAHAESVFYRYIVKVPAQKRNLIRAQMVRNGIHCGLGVLNPLHILAPDSAFPCPNATMLSQTTLSLPIYPRLTEASVGIVVSELRKALES